jgi:hypothetical protein
VAAGVAEAGRAVAAVVDTAVDAEATAAGAAGAEAAVGVVVETGAEIAATAVIAGS